MSATEKGLEDFHAVIGVNERLIETEYLTRAHRRKQGGTPSWREAADGEREGRMICLNA